MLKNKGEQRNKARRKGEQMKKEKDWKRRKIQEEKTRTGNQQQKEGQKTL